MEAPLEQLLYSIEQACAQLGGISRSKLYLEIAAGRLRPTKIGARTFVTRAALEEYVSQAESSSAISG